MISNKHANHGSSKTKVIVTIPERAPSIPSGNPQKNEMNLDKSTDSKMSSAPRRSRTYACTNIDEVAKAFDVDVKDGKLTERKTS